MSTDFAKIFASDERIVEIREYTQGWVAKNYKWKAKGKGLLVSRGCAPEEFEYDRKRQYGKGPMWVAFSASGGRLASE